MSGMIRTLKRSISRSGQTAEERYQMAVSAADYRFLKYGEEPDIPNRKRFRNMNAQGWKRRVKEYLKLKAERERAELQAEKAEAKAKNAAKGKVISRIKDFFTRKRGK